MTSVVAFFVCGFAKKAVKDFYTGVWIWISKSSHIITHFLKWCLIFSMEIKIKRSLSFTDSWANIYSMLIDICKSLPLHWSHAMPKKRCIVSKVFVATSAMVGRYCPPGCKRVKVSENKLRCNSRPCGYISVNHRELDRWSQRLIF